MNVLVIGGTRFVGHFLVWRLLAAGQRVRYRADVHAWHDHRTTVRGWLGRKVTYGRSAAPLARRHGAASIRMTVIHQRETLIAWYERRGYRVTGETIPFPYDHDRLGRPSPRACLLPPPSL